MRLVLSVILGGFCIYGQIPPSETLAPEDVGPFTNEIHRIQKMLETAGDKCTVQYALARTWASGGQYREALDALHRAVGMNVGLDPSHDEIFKKLRGTREFAALLEQARASTPPVAGRSSFAYAINDPELVPESIAAFGDGRSVFLGSVYKGKIVWCDGPGNCKGFAHGLDEVLGLKYDLHTRSVWAASTGPQETALFHFDSSGRLIRKYSLSRTQDRHHFNDLAIGSKGDIFVTDTEGGMVYWVSHLTDRLEVFDPKLKIVAANGIAMSSDGTKLYVAGFPDGITLVDIASKAFHPIGRPADLCLATIDGLTLAGENLIAIQNGVMAERVVRLVLTADGNTIRGWEILGRKNPYFEGITTGTVAYGGFYFVANPQMDKVADGKLKPGMKIDPIRIMKVSVGESAH